MVAKAIVDTGGQGLRTEFKDATRIQESILASVERKVLIWLARKTPLAINPDHLTILGFVAQIAAGFLYALAGRWRAGLLLVNFCIALNWFGDSLDGTLARVRNKQRPRYGFYVDHITDTVGAIAIMFGLAWSGYISERGAAVMLIGFLLLSVNTYLATYALREFKISFWKLGPTEMRILLAIGNVVAFYRPVITFFGARRYFFDVGAYIAGAAMLIIVVVSAIANTARLYNEERL